MFRIYFEEEIYIETAKLSNSVESRRGRYRWRGDGTDKGHESRIVSEKDRNSQEAAGFGLSNMIWLIPSFDFSN
jgi:hypothetical protein